MTPMILFGTLAGAGIVVLVAFVSLFVFYLEDSTLRRWMPRLIAVSVGVLLGARVEHLQWCPRKGSALVAASSRTGVLALWDVGS